MNWSCVFARNQDPSSDKAEVGENLGCQCEEEAASDSIP